MKSLLTVILLALISVSSFAKEQTVTLEVSGMNCATCPITVKIALKNVDGVALADIAKGTKLAVVTFDDDKTNTAALVKATTNAGYPSTVVK